MPFRHALCLLALVPLVQSGVVMPSWFGDYMVLQSNHEYGARSFLNGMADPGEHVTLTDTSGDVYKTVADMTTGEFVIQLNPHGYALHAGDLSIVGEYGDPVVAHNVSWGEVIFCTGQSNMVFPLSVTLNGTEETKVLTTDSHFTGFHFFMTGLATEGTPQWNTSSDYGCTHPGGVGLCDTWMTAAQMVETKFIESFSAVCYITAKNLQRIHTSNAPYGLIQTAWGGTHIEPWMPEAAIRACVPPYTPAPLHGHQTPTYIYNGMVHPFRYMTFRAILWYQGESNAMQPPLTLEETQLWYTCYLQQMINAWRSEKGIGDVPFLVMQLPPSVTNVNATIETQTGRQQIRLAEETVVPQPFGPIDISGITATLDLGGVSNWGADHPPNKIEFGRRMALTVAHVAFGVQGRLTNTKAGTPEHVWSSYWTGPVFAAAAQDAANHEIVLSFDTDSAFSMSLRNVTGRNAPSQAKAYGEWNNCTKCCPGLPPFEVSYNFTTWHRIPVTDVGFTNNATTVTLRNVNPAAVSLRYAWADFVDCVLVNGDDLPAGPFVWNFTTSFIDEAADAGTEDIEAEIAANYKPLQAVPTKPALGYNTWNYYHCNIDENSVRSIVDAMVENGMKDAGFEYVNIDDCWQVGRMPNGTIIPDPVRFPSGMKAVADYAHSKGMKFGVYTARAANTCQKRPGSYGHETIDAQTYCDWGVDYVKIDRCGGADYKNASDSWSKFRAGFDKCYQTTGRYIWASVEYCKTTAGCGEWVAEYANSWRTTGDIQATWASVMSNAKNNNAVASLAKAGHYNDADALEVGNQGLTEDEQKVQMTLWIIMATPLLAATNVITPSAATLALFTNKEAVSIILDAGAGGKPQGTMLPSSGTEQLWVKHLNDSKSLAVGVVNTGSNTTSVAVQWSALGLSSSQPYSLRDLWGQVDLGTFNTSHSWTLAAHSCVFILFSPSS